jgi:DMSO/TMAO reductase YedYZ molybdopterin-dependent catalytic subunit
MDAPSPHGRVLSRREILRQAGLVAVGIAVTPVPGWPLAWFRRDQEVVPFTDVPPSFTGRRPADPEPFPGANLIAQDLRNLSEWITPIDDFFVVTHYGIPEIDASVFRLRIVGLVERPLSLSIDELRSRERVEHTCVFECGGNSRGLFHGMVGNATWAGVDVHDLLSEAGVDDAALEAHFWGADAGTEEIRGNEYRQNFARSMSLTDIRERRPILAYEMNGEPLPIVHGFPLRVIVPGWYGVANVKWLERIDVSPERLMTRFMARDYVTLMSHERDGRTDWVETSVTRQRVKSVIARVTRAERDFRVFGAAWSDGTPLRAVEVRVNDGEWLPAELEVTGDPTSWTFFALRVSDLPEGENTLVSRATDVQGRTQPVDLANKVTRWENNELFVRRVLVTY